MDRKLQRHRADSLRQHGFLVLYCVLYIVCATFRWMLSVRPSRSWIGQKRLKYSPYTAQETDERLVNVTITSTESDILREIDFAAIIKDFAVAIEKGVWPLNVDCVWRYNHCDIWRGDGGDLSSSLDFSVPALTEIESMIPEWDAFNPPHWNELCPSVSEW